MPSERLTIRLPKPLQEQLDALARQTGRTESELARDALADYCERQQAAPTCYDVAKEAGFLGCVEGGADDLSVNPAHWEGFGRE
jgi:hypothetical protein